MVGRTSVESTHLWTQLKSSPEQSACVFLSSCTIQCSTHLFFFLRSPFVISHQLSLLRQVEALSLATLSAMIAAQALPIRTPLKAGPIGESRGIHEVGEGSESDGDQSSTEVALSAAVMEFASWGGRGFWLQSVFTGSVYVRVSVCACQCFGLHKSLRISVAKGSSETQGSVSQLLFVCLFFLLS